MIRSILVAIAATFILAAPANALDFYGKVEAGVSDNITAESFDLQDGKTFGAAIGTTVGPFRVEAGASQIDAEAFGGIVSADATNYRATVYADLFNNDTRAFFIGAGVNYVDADISLGYGSVSDSGQGWHYTAGYSRRIGSGLIGEVAYTNTQVELFGADVEASTFTVGLRFPL